MASATAHIQSDTTATAASELYNPIKGQRFFPIPAFIASRNDLTTNAKIVYGYLCSCFGRDGLIHPKLETISREAGLSSKQQASRCVSELKAAGLIAVVRTGRASYYRFLDPGAGDHAQPDQPKNECQADSESSQNCSRVSEMITQKPPTPYIENNPPKKQTTPPRVVVLPDDDLVQKAFDAVPEKHQTPGVKRTLQAGIANYDIDDILKAVEYTNGHSNSSYSGYLSGAIKGNWAEDWTPPAVHAAQKTANDVAIEAQSQKEIEKHITSNCQRDELAEAWLKLPAEKRAEVRQEYLSTCGPVILKKAKFRTDKQLAGSTGFRFFLENREEKCF